MKRSRFEIYYGPMFSGKSALMIKDILNNIDTPKLVFKPKGDVRSEKVYTREGLEFEAIAIDTASEILSHIEEWVEKVYIDEINFFDESLVGVVKELLDMGIDVVASGLDTNFRAEYFKASEQLIELADKGIRLKARCHVCGEGSAWTARYINGEPAGKDSPTLLSDTLDDSVEYKTVCTKHHPFLGKE